MDKKFTSLKEVSDYAHSLIRDKSEQELKKLDPIELLEWFIASQRFVAEKAVEIIKDAGIKVVDGILDINVSCLWQDNHYLARCEYSQQQIIIGAHCLFCVSYNQLVGTIIHELTHIEVLNHNNVFWQRYLEILKIEGLADPDLTVEEAFLKRTTSVHRDETEKLPLLHFDLRSTHMYHEFLSKYHQIRRNPIFGRDCWHNIRRLNDIDFNEDVVRLCKEYEVDYNALYRLSHYGRSLPDFIGFDKQWNPYTHAY